MSDVQVVGDRNESSLDARRGVTNTKLAAIMLVMHAQLAPQPFTSILKPGGKRVTTVWFLPGIKVEDKVIDLKDVEAAFLTGGSEAFPMVGWMKKALDCRDWLIKEVIYGQKVPTSGQSAIISPHWFVTEELQLASVLVGADHKLQFYRDHKFYFPPDAKKSAAEYMKGEGESPINWMRSAVLQQDLLMQVIKGPSNPNLIQVKNASTGAELTFNDRMPAELQRLALAELHKS